MSHPRAERLRALVVGTDSERRAEVARALDTGRIAVETVRRPDAGRQRLGEVEFDAVVVDLASLTDGLEFLRSVREGADAPVTALTEDARFEAAFDAGATDCVHVAGRSDPFTRLAGRVRSIVAWRGPEGERARAAITEDLMKRAMDAAPIGITVSAPDLPDNPLVYVNDSYADMTGYERSETLGRNCRFLQGQGSDSETVAAMREAVATNDPVSVELVNYRRDGTSFWNRVDIAPVRDESGTVTHFVGFQTDITERKRAEAEAKRYAVAAAREREHLKHLVDRIEGLLRDVTAVLVRGESRQRLETEVCERLVESGPYAAAWIGDVDMGADVIVPRVSVGSGTAAPPDELTLDRREGSIDPTVRAVAAREVEIGRDDGEGLHPDGPAFPDALRSVAAVPLAHRETLYGVLNVYAGPPDAFDRERVVLSLLGRSVGAAISAVESRRVLFGTAVTELEIGLEDDTFAPLAAAIDARIAYEGAVPRDGGSVTVFATVAPDDDRVSAVAEDLPGVEQATRVTVRENGESATGLYEFRCSSDSFVTRVVDAGGRIRRFRAEKGFLELLVETADRSTARSLFAGLREVFEEVELLRSRDRDRQPRTRRDLLGELEDLLTERQRTALRTAYLAGYFEWPHAVSGDELADAMGVSRSTFHQHLRTAQRKFLNAVYEPDAKPN
jgi:PAS domain S-box-containing protein